jgi:thioredoxin-related protein
MIILYPLCHYGQERINWRTFQEVDSLINIAPKETIIFIHTDWCSYCRKMEKEIFTKKEIYDRINKDFYMIHLDAESVEDITFDQHVWRSETTTKTTGQYHPLALLLLTNQRMIFPSILRYDKTFRLKKIQQKYLNTKALIDFLK